MTASSPSCDLVALHVFPFGDFLARSRMAACNRLLRREATSAEDGPEVRRRWATERLLEAGAPDGLLRHLDAGPSLRWMERRDLAYGGSTGYIDFLTPRDFGPGKPALYGRDPCGRFYLAASYVWRGRTGVACLFQRYCDDPAFFANCLDRISEEVFTSHFCAEGRSRISEHHADVLELVSRGTYELPSGESVYLTA